MRSWDDWSDEDLSYSILITIHGEVINHFCLSDCKTYVYDCGVIGESFYCVDLIDINKPADMWPIIVTNGIGVEKETIPFCDDFNEMIESDCWEASHCIRNISYSHINPLRAAAIVFLMMNGVTPNENQN